MYFNVSHTLGSMLLCITSDDQVINWCKKWIDFVKNKFHLNENIEQHFVQLEFNGIWIEIQLNLD